jgi:hypothetical protein
LSYFGSNSSSLELPDNLEESFDLAFSLSSQDWEKFFMDCSWYYQAIDIWQKFNSSAFIALVSAIECLVPKGQEICSFCGQPKYRVTKRFKDFLEKHVPFLATEFHEEKKFIYQVRSDLSHGLDLLIQDMKPWTFMLNPRAQKQDILQRNLYFITRVAIYNWLWIRQNTKLLV